MANPKKVAAQKKKLEMLDRTYGPEPPHRPEVISARDWGCLTALAKRVAFKNVELKKKDWMTGLKTVFIPKAANFKINGKQWAGRKICIPAEYQNVMHTLTYRDNFDKTSIAGTRGNADSMAKRAKIVGG